MHVSIWVLHITYLRIAYLHSGPPGENIELLNQDWRKLSVFFQLCRDSSRGVSNAKLAGTSIGDGGCSAQGADSRTAHE